jgi:cytochrome P450
MRAASDDLTFPMPRDLARCPFDPPPALRDVRSSEGLRRVRIWNGSEPWLVTRHADIRAVLSHPAISADGDKEGYPHQSAAYRARRTRAQTFLTKDGPEEHDEPRRILARDFTAKRMHALRLDIQAITDRLIDEMLAGEKPADLVQKLALPVPTLMICNLLGVPYADHARFQHLTTVFVAATSTADDTFAAAEELLAYVGELIDAKSVDPGDDLLSRLVVEQMLPGHMTREEVARMGILVLTAGHETSANMIALGTAALLANPDQLELMRIADDPAVVAGAVEELLRYLTILHNGLRRVATEDIEIAGTLIRRGEGVILALPAGNRDPEAFGGDGILSADELDITRPARHHVGFGFGPHQCLGQQLARVELQIVFSTLFRRIPTLALAEPLADVPFKTDMSIYGVHRLLVTW